MYVYNVYVYDAQTYSMADADSIYVKKFYHQFHVANGSLVSRWPRFELFSQFEDVLKLEKGFLVNRTSLALGSPGTLACLPEFVMGTFQPP